MTLHRLGAAGLVATIVFAATVGHAESIEPDGLDWSPTLALGVVAQGQRGEAESNLSWPACANPIPKRQITRNPQNFPPPVTGCFGEPRPLASGSPNLTTGVPDLRVGLYGPSLDFISERIRPFVHGGWQYGWMAFDTETIAADEGNLSPLLFPLDSNNPDNVQGVGTLITADVENGWFAGLGLAIEVPWEGYQLRLLPSADYYGQRIRVEGASRRVAELVEFNPFGPGDRAVFGIEESTGTTTKTLHAVGPRLGLEVDVGRAGSLVTSVFLDVGAFWFLGDREITADAVGDAPGDFSFEPDPVTIHGGAGIRFSWRPSNSEY